MLTEDHDKIIEIDTNVKWMREAFTKHVESSEDFRNKALKNASGIFWIKWVVAFHMVLILVILKAALTP